MARPLRDAGLRRVTVSLDSLDEDTFARMNGRAHRLAPVLRGIEAATAAGFPGIKLNAVVIRGINDHQVLDMVRRFPRHGSYRAVHRVHGRRQPQRVAARAGGAVPGNAGGDRRGVPAGARGAGLPRRGGVPVPLHRRAGGDRVHLFGEPAVLRRLHAHQAVRGGEAVHLPFCGQGLRPSRSPAARRGRRRASLPGRERCGRAASIATRRSGPRPAVHGRQKVEMYHIGG